MRGWHGKWEGLPGFRCAPSGYGVRTRSPRFEGHLDRRTIGPPSQHAILVSTQLRHRVGKPDAAIDDQAENREGEQVIHHAMPVTIVFAPSLIFGEVVNRRTQWMGPAQIVVAGARHARPEQNYPAFLLVPLGLLRFHLGLAAAQ